MRGFSRSITAGLLAGVALLSGSASAVAADEASGRIDHVSTARGEVNVLYSLPGLPDGVSADLDTLQVVVDGKPVEAEARTASSAPDTVRRTAVLAIDVSASMDGAKFDAARDAALAYIDEAPDDVYIGIVTFASNVIVAQQPTKDKQALEDAVKGLSLTSKTRLYDGVLRALDLTGHDGQRSILLLSDGKDTSTTALSTVLAKAADADVRIDSIALGQDVDADSPLTKISDATKGTITETTKASDLQKLFTAEAADLATQLVITFPAPSGDTNGSLQVSVDAGGRQLSDSAFVTLKGSTPAGASAAPRYAAADPGGLEVPTSALLGGVVALFVGLAMLLGFAMTRMTRAEATPMQQQLSLYTVHGMRTAKRSREHEGGASQLKESAVAIADKLMEKRDFEESLAHKLDRAGLHLKPAEWLLLHVGMVVGAPLVGFLLTGGNIVFTLILFVAGGVLPWMYLSFRESRRIKAFQQGLAQTLQIIAGALQAGLSLPQAVDTVVQEGTEPIAGEFRRAIIEQRLGVEIEDSLESVADRMGSLDFRWVVMAIRIQREVGGNLAELLLTVSATLREREYLRRQVSVLSAEGRLSAFILGGLPPVFVAYLAMTRPTYLAPMIHTPIGWGMIVTGVVLMTVGVIWLRQAVKVVV